MKFDHLVSEKHIQAVQNRCSTDFGNSPCLAFRLSNGSIWNARIYHVLDLDGPLEEQAYGILIPFSYTDNSGAKNVQWMSFDAAFFRAFESVPARVLKKIQAEFVKWQAKQDLVGQ